MGMGIRYRDKESDTTVNAINEGYIEVNQLEVSKGRMLDSSDFLSGNRVGVITSDMKKSCLIKRKPLDK